MLRALSHRVYRRLFLAQVVALLGTGLATMALAFLAYDLAGKNSGKILGIALAIKMVAYVVIAPLAQAALARIPRRQIMVGADLIRLVVALGLPAVSEVWQVYVLIFLLHMASATFTPTFQATIPDVLTNPQDYTAALSLSRLAYDLESIVSPLLAGLLLLAVSPSTLFFGTALGFAGSAALVVSAVLPPRLSASPPDQSNTFVSRWRQGPVTLWTSTALRPILAVNFAVASVGAVILVDTVVIVRGELGQPAAIASWLLAALGLGSMVAAIAVPALVARWPLQRVIEAGTVLMGAVAVMIPLALSGQFGQPHSGVIAGLWFLAGAGWSLAETPVGQLITQEVSSDHRPSVFAAQFSLSHACWLVAYPLAGVLGADQLAMSTAVMAGLCVLSAVVASLSWSVERAKIARRLVA